MRSSAKLRAITMMERRIDHYVQRASADDAAAGNEERISGDCYHAMTTASCRTTVATPCNCNCIATSTARCCHTQSPRTPCSCTTTTMTTYCRTQKPETRPPCCCCTPTTAARCSWVPLTTQTRPPCSCTVSTTTAAYNRICTTQPNRAWSISCHTPATPSTVFSRLPCTSTTTCRTIPTFTTWSRPSYTCSTTACSKFTPPQDIQNRWTPITNSEWLDNGSPPTTVTCQIRRTTTECSEWTTPRRITCGSGNTVTCPPPQTLCPTTIIRYWTTTTCRTTCATDTTEPTTTSTCNYMKVPKCTCTKIRHIRLRV